MKNPYETEEQVMFRDSLSRYIAQKIRPNVDEWDEAGDFPRQLHLDAGEMGAYGLGIPAEYGGMGHDDAFLRLVLAEEWGKCGANGIPASLFATNIMTQPLVRLASEQIKQTVLPKLMSGEESGCLGITEPSGGSDVANLKTTARRDGDEYVLNGSKYFITGGLRGSHFVVGARTGGEGLHGISLFYVHRDTPGFTRESVGDKMGWWASDTAGLYFDDCRVPAAHLLGEEHRGFTAIMLNFNNERLGIAGQVMGSAKLCLEESIKYAQERVTFGHPLIRHQVIRHKIAEMSARIDAVEAYLNQICALINMGEPVHAEVTKAKFLATSMNEYVTSEAMQIFGGAAYLRGNVVERMYREVKVLSIGGGSEEIMRDLSVRLMGL